MYPHLSRRHPLERHAVLSRGNQQSFLHLSPTESDRGQTGAPGLEIYPGFLHLFPTGIDRGQAGAPGLEIYAEFLHLSPIEAVACSEHCTHCVFAALEDGNRSGYFAFVHY